MLLQVELEPDEMIVSRNLKTGLVACHHSGEERPSAAFVVKIEKGADLALYKQLERVKLDTAK